MKNEVFARIEIKISGYMLARKNLGDKDQWKNRIINWSIFTSLVEKLPITRDCTSQFTIRDWLLDSLECCRLKQDCGTVDALEWSIVERTALDYTSTSLNKRLTSNLRRLTDMLRRLEISAGANVERNEFGNGGVAN